MKYLMPDDIKDQPLYERSFVLITPDSGEELIDCALKIIRAAINNAPIRQGKGWLDPRVNEPTITEEDLQFLRNEIKNDRILIEYWKGQPVKLLLTFDKKNNVISLDTAVWMDRWNVSGAKKKPSFTINALLEVLDEALKTDEITPLEKGKCAGL